MTRIKDKGVAGESLRHHLRAATMAAHDLLDHAMQAASGWQTRSDYARFLGLQHAARVPVEAWLAEHAPADLRPPLQTPLIARDLSALGTGLPPASPPFDPGYTPSSPPLAGVFHVKHSALGVAWVLAGSALGNAAIGRQVKRIGDGVWPMAFLGDAAMMAFWQGLRARIEGEPASPAEAAGATQAAEAVFAHFLGVADGGQVPERQAESTQS
ncbi:biliverdin-producing heme oxygenase [Erythrobacter sp. WG]|uniref:biliverdin-producing heme oxygenase n=1 Tax=Erythrobacter sp. WG TaxID=2985510 RepID=UPI00226F9962|nr:biliverdin-producing heme oxygenase [Erythrobacter sp. WG]MCX9148400.1 biliverdin-producing heme oxygenase [Erythrobacter sp. WG]